MRHKNRSAMTISTFPVVTNKPASRIVDAKRKSGGGNEIVVGKKRALMKINILLVPSPDNAYKFVIFPLK